jgi:dihydrodipicolinate synthase/N-acetylneuraminate lyase
MLTSDQIGGLMAMMPAFATDQAANLRAKSTIHIDNLHAGVDKIVRDGANVITTTGSFGECHTLLLDEFRTLACETVAAVEGRVPLFVGVTSVNSREVVEKMAIVADSGADGVLVGVPYYLPSSIDNAVRFFRDIADMYPKLALMIYHNPALHHVKLSVDAFQEIVKIPNVVGMKDSHRDTLEFAKLQKIIANKISVFVYQGQYYPYADLGAAGFWSIDAWMGPWPLLALRDAVRRGDKQAAAQITLDISPPGTAAPNLVWRESAMKIGTRLAGYVDPGPLRPPFVEVPAQIIEQQKARVERWRLLCEKYPPALAVPQLT